MGRGSEDRREPLATRVTETRAPSGRRLFISTEDMYDDNPQRRYSREIDFGVMWSTPSGFPKQRVTLIADTGELYISTTSGTCEILARFESEEHAEQALAGWEEACTMRNSIGWLLERISSAGAALE